MVELLPALASLGGGGTLVAVIVYLLASNRADRTAATERIAAANARADLAEARAAKAIAGEDAAILRARLAEAQVVYRPPPPMVDPAAPPMPQLESGELP